MATHTWPKQGKMQLHALLAPSPPLGCFAVVHYTLSEVVSQQEARLWLVPWSCTSTLSGGGCDLLTAVATAGTAEGELILSSAAVLGGAGASHPPR